MPAYVVYSKQIQNDTLKSSLHAFVPNPVVDTSLIWLAHELMYRVSE